MAQQAKLLVVEDNDMNRNLIIRRFEKWGYQMVSAVNGAEGVNQAKKELPALILMDVNMPIMDGLEAIRQIRANSNTQHIPIIVITAHTEMDDKDLVMESGCNDFEEKPIQFERLHEKIKRLLAK
jgi:two-component system cell cycle response regulator DivK